MDDPVKTVLTKYPHFIASQYQRLLDTKTPQQQVERALGVYEVSIRALALSMISQYLVRDKDILRFDPFSDLISDSLIYATFGTWTKIFFSAMEAYKGRSDLLLITQLHDLCWELGTDGYTSRSKVRATCDRIVQIWADLRPGSSTYPKSETDWENLANETVTVLKRFLSYFTFIENYEIICVRNKDKDSYQYESYTGTEIELVVAKIVTDQPLQVDWYYLYNRTTNEFLHLHPLVVLLTNQPALTRNSSQVSFFDHLTKETSYYWEPDRAQIVPRSDLMTTVLDWIYFAIERYKAYQREVAHLDWEILQEVCQAISKDSMGASQTKYRQELYLQREQVVYAFRDFVDSEKSCFILTGKSGVGKTNFLLSLLNDHQEKKGICFLVYNGAFLRADQDIKGQITEQFTQRLKFREREKEAQIEDFLLEINRIPGIKARKFILMIDAINENIQPAYLLKSVDSMVRSVGAEQNWFKVVISSRPEAWRQMYRRAKPLAENRYYRLHGQQELGVELPEFQIVGAVDQAVDLTYKLPVFGKDEVKAAYEKYQREFRLKSSYKDLKPTVRQELRDPLVMRLLAEIYADDSIPTTISISEIYRNYVKALIRSGRVQVEDELFLQTEFVPLMAEDGYTNEVTSSQINCHGLRLQILGEEVGSSGRAVNQSFQNLADADILTRHEVELDYVIRFTFERFYDYYFGQFLYRQMTGSENAASEYLQLVTQVTTTPFLWGAIKNALLLEMRRQNPELILELCQVSDQLVREVVVDVLTEYGREQPQGVRELVDDLLAEYTRKKSFIHTIGTLVSSRDSKVSSAASNKATIALEVARKFEWADILVWAAVEPPETIRVLAFRNIYHLWRKDSLAGYDALQAIADRVPGLLGIPNVAALQSCLGLSLLMMSHYRYTEEESRISVHLDTLVDIWRQVIEQVLLATSSRQWTRRPAAMLRTLVLKAIIRFVIRLVNITPKNRPAFFRDTELFFQASEAIRQRYGRLVNLIETPIQDFGAVKRDLFAAIDDNDNLTSAVVYILLICQHKLLPPERKSKLIELISEAFDYSLSKPTIGLFTKNFAIVVAEIDIGQTEVEDQIYYLNERMMMAYLDKTRGVFYSNLGTPHTNLGLGEHCTMRKTRKNPSDSNLHRRYVRLAVDEHDWPFFELLIYELSAAAIAFQCPEHTLEALTTILPELRGKHSVVAPLVIDLLARIRVYFPDLIEDFIDDCEFDETLANEIRRKEFVEHPWADVLLPRAASVIARFLQVPSVREAIAIGFRGALDCKNMSEFMEFTINRLINLIHGQPVFSQAN